jgi:hypothetical protein
MPQLLTITETAEELDRRAAERAGAAAKLPAGTARQSILRDVAQLRTYADIKRLLASSGLKSPEK